MPTADRDDEGVIATGDTGGRQDPRRTLKAGWWRTFGDRQRARRGMLVPAVLGLGGLGLVVWFLAFTSPGHTIDDVANLNVSINAPSGSLTTPNASAEVHLTSEGGAAATVEVYFICKASATLTIELTSREALRFEYSPDSPGPRLSNSLLSRPTVRPLAEGVQVSGDCGANKPVNLPFTVEFPAGTVAAPLERGRYAFGMDLFVANSSDVLSSNSYAIGLVTPQGGLLTDAFDANSRTFNRATWEATSEFSLPAYGTYSMPEQVAQAQWWENLILLLLGAIVGIAIEAALRRARPQHDPDRQGRSTRSEGGHPTGAPSGTPTASPEDHSATGDRVPAP